MTGLRGIKLKAVAPIALLVIGVVGKDVIRPTTRLPLRTPLSDFPEVVGEFTMGATGEISDGERRVLRADDYMLRNYQDADGRHFSLFVAYYGLQGSGSSIHSPRNCLPGSGWEPVSHDQVVVDTPYGPRAVNRYIVEHSTGARSLVFYWYQGRGRVASNEYLVKLDLLGDAILRRRTDEALVRVVVPLRSDAGLDEAESRDLIEGVAGALAPHLPA